MIILFCCLMIGVFGRLLVFAVRCAWGLFKVAGTLVFLPIALVIMAAGGLIRLALPLLIVFGIFTLIADPAH